MGCKLTAAKEDIRRVGEQKTTRNSIRIDGFRKVLNAK
jgi:hypothetical protein